MKKAIIGKKVGMTQIFDEAGKVIPVTVIEAGPCTVVAKMTKEKEGYDAVQFGYEEVAEKKLSKPEQGHLKKAGVAPLKHLKEFRLEDSSKLEVGDVVKADVFAEGEKVDVTGISKGHGYAGGLQVTLLALAELLAGYFLVTELDCLVSFLLLGHLLHDHAGAGLDDGHGNDLASLIEDLRHADLLADDGFLHCISS